MHAFTAPLAAALFAATVAAHGRVTSPTPRPLGTAMEDACGVQVYDQMAADPNGNIQSMAQTGATQTDFDATECHLWQCRGFQYADATTASIQSYTAGEVVDFTVDIVAPHTGVANVSVIDLAANAVLGDALASWSVYASTATGVTANETGFSVTIPSDLPSTCATAGGCALQWWWDARSIDQTYMNCIDFVVGDASGTAAVATTAAAATSASGSTAVAASTSSSSVAVSSVSTSSASTFSTVTASKASSSVASTSASTSTSAKTSAASLVTSAAVSAASSCTVRTRTVTVTV